MNIFYPEWCIPENHKESEFQFTCPVWSAKKVKRGEPTVLASSVGSTKSGLHFEIIKADDAVTDKNTESTEQCATVSKKLYLAHKLLRLGGYYVDYIGTRYDDEDHYGVMQEQNSVGELKTEKFSNIDLIENATTATKILIGRGIVIKPEVVAKLKAEGRPVTYHEAGEDGCTLLLPHLMPYSWCLQEYGKNEETFEGQINQNPRPATTTTFERKDLEAATVVRQDMPFRGLHSQTWDFAYSVKKGRNFSTASDVIWDDKGRMFVNDLIRSRFKQNDLAQAVVDFAKKWHPFLIRIENSNGADFLEPAILEKAKQSGDEYVIQVCSKIDWFRPDTTVDAKRMRMGALHPWLMEGNLKFSNTLPYLETLYNEFERCMTSRSAVNDIPDVISHQPACAPQVMRMVDKKEISSWTPGSLEWLMLFEGADEFGRVGYEPPIPVVEIEPDPEIGNMPYIPGLENVLGAGLTG